MKDQRIALCLSGGGLRATLFHLGVVRALRECKVEGVRAFDRITEIYSVSGGSILAAHMLLRWDLYSGDEEAFDAAQAEVYRLAQRNIRDRVLRRAALSAIPLRLRNLFSDSPVCGRVHWLMGEYDHLLKKARIDEAIEANGPKPKFHILSTNFRTGELCSFSGSAFEVESHNGRLSSTPCGHLTLSRAVTASSAFPPMFPPMVLDDKLLARPHDDAFLLPLQLSDGGVYDNLGIEKFWRNHDRAPELASTLIVSNAGSPFRSEATRRFSGMLSRNVRASDILMRRIGMVAEAGIAASDKIDDIVIRLTDSVPDAVLDPAVQQTLRLVRTDLDRFQPELADLLVQRGAGAAMQKFAERGWPGPETPRDWPSDPASRERQKAVATRAEARSFLSLPFDWRDWKPLLLLWLIAGLLTWQAESLWSEYRVAQQAEEAAKDNNRRDLAKLTATLVAARDALRVNDFDGARQIIEVAIGETQAQEEQIAASLAPEPITETPAQAAVTVGSQAVTYPLRVYIQFAGNLTRNQIEELNAGLGANGWQVQGKSGERIASAATLNEVRYAGDNQEAAQKLADAINAAGIASSKVSPRQVPVVGDRNLEVWISN